MQADVAHIQNAGDGRTHSLFLIRRLEELKALIRDGKPIAQSKAKQADYRLLHNGGSLWVLATWRGGAGFAFCVAPELGSRTTIVDVHEERAGDVRVSVNAVAGEYSVHVELPTPSRPTLHWRTAFRPNSDLTVAAWPRDVMPIDPSGDPIATMGIVHAAQQGITGNMLFASFMEPAGVERGSLLYVQNLGALTDYFEQTQLSASDRVGGIWPEVGFELPASASKPMSHGREYVVSDAYVCLAPKVPADDIESARLFLDMYGDIYLRYPRPVPEHRDWPRRVQETVRDLSHSPKCGEDIEGNRYAFAYAGSDDRPPESMVQLAILTPLTEYADSRGLHIPLRDALERNIPTFYDAKLQTIARWLPLRNHQLRGQEEQMKPNLMDSWYLLHTCANLGRLALRGATWARELFDKSLAYNVKVARHFDYRWPVFYQMETLEIEKAETKPGSGGEHDVGALYAHVMLMAYDLTKEKRYVDEAVKAAVRLRGLAFNLGYQFNNVSFGAAALYRLCKITGDQQFHGLSDVCWANVVRNLWMWDCKYGHAKHYSTFMGLAPLQDAPYLALYEELEVLGAIHEYFRVAGDEVAPALRVLLPEYCKYLIDRAWFHYPSELPSDVIADKPQSGTMHRYLSIPVEDLREGWEKAGQVGQEVYGGAAPFIIATRHCHQVPGEEFILHCNYPAADFETQPRASGGSATFRLEGDARCEAMVRIVADNYAALPRFKVLINDKRGERQVEGKMADLGYFEYAMPGNADVSIAWDKRVLSLGSTPIDQPRKRAPARPATKSKAAARGGRGKK